MGLFRRRAGRRRSGAAVVEFALVLPLLLLFFVISMDFARLYYFTQVVSDCARVGALYASNPDLADASPYETVQQAIAEAAHDLDEPPVVVVSEKLDSRGRKCTSVTVSYTGRLITQFVGIPSTYNISRTGYARVYPAALAEDEP